MIDDDILEAVWQWLPPRPDRRRAITVGIAAADLGLPVRAVSDALAELRSRGRIEYSRRGQPYRSMEIGGVPCSSTRRG